jgi:phage terminase large subunit
MKRLMSEEEYLQEMECSFEASSRGAFYARELTQADVGPYPADPALHLHFVFDIGRTDDTALGAFQEHPTHVTMVHAEAENGRGPAYWLTRIHDICAAYGCERGTVWLPPDARAKTWATLRSGWEQFVDAGIRPRLIPSLDVMDGINAARYIFQHTKFNEESTETLILALKSYRRKWDEEKQAFSNDAIHDWSSHPADMFRYFALVARFPHSRPLDVVSKILVPPTAPITPATTLTHYPVTLEDMWRDYDGSRKTERV